jgi:hypothetical protein
MKHNPRSGDLGGLKDGVAGGRARRKGGGLLTSTLKRINLAMFPETSRSPQCILPLVIYEVPETSPPPFLLSLSLSLSSLAFPFALYFPLFRRLLPVPFVLSIFYCSPGCPRLPTLAVR